MESAKIEEKENFLLVSRSEKKRLNLGQAVNMVSKGLNYTFGRCIHACRRPNKNRGIRRKIFTSFLNIYTFKIQTYTSRCCYELPSSASDIHNSSPRLNRATVKWSPEGHKRFLCQSPPPTPGLGPIYHKGFQIKFIHHIEGRHINPLI